MNHALVRFLGVAWMLLVTFGATAAVLLAGGVA